jgi:uncharacterized glyoxalase superfamily protein PhnB
MVTKLTPIAIVDAIEPVLPLWEGLGFARTVEVPHEGRLGFVILARDGSELMLQTRASVGDDLGIEPPAYLLYCDVRSLAAATRAARAAGAEVLIEARSTPYGAIETWIRDAAGVITGLSAREA